MEPCAANEINGATASRESHTQTPDLGARLRPRTLTQTRHLGARSGAWSALRGARNGEKRGYTALHGSFTQRLESAGRWPRSPSRSGKRSLEPLRDGRRGKKRSCGFTMVRLPRCRSEKRGLEQRVERCEVGEVEGKRSYGLTRVLYPDPRSRRESGSGTTR